MAAQVAVIGAGQVSSWLRGQLERHNFRVRAYELKRNGLDEVVRPSAVVTSVEAAAESCDFVISCLDEDRDVEEMVLGGHINRVMKSGSTLIDASSSSLATTRKIAAALAQRGVDMIDVSVNWRDASNEFEGVVVAAGGNALVIQRCRPILGSLRADIYHVGPLGTGHAVAALNALLLGTALLATAEAVNVAAGAGIPLQTALDVFNVSSGRSYASSSLFPKVVATGTYRSGIALGQVEKSLKIAVEMARARGLQTPMADRLLLLYRLMLVRLRPDADNTDVTRYLEVLSGRRRSRDV